MRRIFPALLALCLLTPAIAFSRDFHVYVGNLSSDHVLIAWGTTNGKNTIGRSSPLYLGATLKIAGREIRPLHNYVLVTNLAPDTDYPYEVLVEKRKVGAGKIHTWPAKSDTLCFFVIGDWGNGSKLQYQVAEAMTSEYRKHAGSGCPVRFVISTGDNIYGWLTRGYTGNSDKHWETKFFKPYASLLAEIPFFPVLGNHDGNESEKRSDLPVYLDNFFFPEDRPGRYYRFSYGGLADFFALDSTRNSETGARRPAYLENGPQHKWLVQNLGSSEVPWKIPYFHHPAFTAGPLHRPSGEKLAHFVSLFQQNGVRVVFSGHEHNFQWSAGDNATGHIRYVVSGAGGELRRRSVLKRMNAAHIEGWSDQSHFLSVEIHGREMKITPLSFAPITVLNPEGNKISAPLTVSLPESKQ